MKIIDLGNGAILTYQHTKLKKTSAEIGFLCGSNDNPKNGLCHFLEHGFFGGFNDLSKNDVQNELNKIIPTYNATTSNHRVYMSFARSSKLAEKAFELTANMMLHSNYKQEFIDSERNVIEEEYKRKLDAFKNSVSYFHEQMMWGTKINPTFENRLGSAEDLAKITQQDFFDFRKKYFCQQNFFASIVSNLSVCKIKKLLKKYFLSKIPSNPEIKPPRQVLYNSCPSLNKHFQILQNDSQQARFDLSFKINNDDPTGLDKSYFYFKTNTILRFLNDYSDGVFHALRTKGIVYTSSVYINSFRNALFVTFHVECSKTKIDEAIKTINEVLVNLKKNKISLDILKEIQFNNILAKDETEKSKTKDICDNIITDFLYYNRNTEKYFKKRGKFIRSKKFPFNEVNELISTIFNKNNEMFLSIKGNILDGDIEINEQNMREIVYKNF